MVHTLAQLRAGHLAGATQLHLSEPLDGFPDDIFALADTLEVLDLNGTGLSALPDDLHRLHRLRILFCSNNAFTELPKGLGACPSLSMIGFKSNRIRSVPPESLPEGLRWLILTDNEVEALPDSIGRCTALQKCMLAGNEISLLPESMKNCTSLELLRLSANRFDVLPDWLCDLPRLSWLAFAGNPFSTAAEAQALTDPAIETVPWAELDLDDRLGEGASGVIYRARYRSGTVAVKLFKGGMTSDGLPQSEMAACLSAGRHPHLIPIRGRVCDHPQSTPVLVMDLIDPAFTTLAGPPSFATCTRDVYAPSLRLETAAIVRMLQGLASAAQHLHSKGVMHGDFYGHNILHDGRGAARLGDFGAASFYATGTARFERLEVRAFGCLIEELLTLCEDAPLALIALKAACLAPDPAERPLFADIHTALAAEAVNLQN
ncbi:leucine-rich repeat-containing protein kinase family protein [Asticcacaulis sp. BYS171W]|uniref:Leucine-rich repeat-containing protein kinase family protein n=1 Tax=Asticcacaulis aquaticus TaxID=2984212 RepID=A0ABT5HSW5_9CAUL|nr:leucine-rich repeat-containing protein kinase family protein [Asticcacaulis aquaticus]MDC7683162.1 leucine-rich repeat-containing protein kinase family protein [Asticcacaulis aquaticus]